MGNEWSYSWRKEGSRSYSGCSGPGKVAKTPSGKRQAVRWLGMATGLCKSTHGELKTGVIPSRDGESAMAAVSGREIEAKEWPPEFADSSRLSTGQAAR